MCLVLSIFVCMCNKKNRLHFFMFVSSFQAPVFPSPLLPLCSGKLMRKPAVPSFGSSSKFKPPKPQPIQGAQPSIPPLTTMKLQARSPPCSPSSQCRMLWMLPCSPSTAALCEQYACSCSLGAYVMSSRQILRGKYLLAPHGGNSMISSERILPLLWCRFH